MLPVKTRTISDSQSDYDVTVTGSGKKRKPFCNGIYTMPYLKIGAK
jgi:hypothetical protein